MSYETFIFSSPFIKSEKSSHFKSHQGRIAIQYFTARSSKVIHEMEA